VSHGDASLQPVKLSDALRAREASALYSREDLIPLDALRPQLVGTRYLLVGRSPPAPSSRPDKRPQQPTNCFCNLLVVTSRHSLDRPHEFLNCVNEFVRYASRNLERNARRTVDRQFAAYRGSGPLIEIFNGFVIMQAVLHGVSQSAHVSQPAKLRRTAWPFEYGTWRTAGQRPCRRTRNRSMRGAGHTAQRLAGIWV
jgi:hypothetical protein